MATWEHQVTVLIDADTRRVIDEIVAATGVSMGAVLRLALRHGLPVAQREARRVRLQG